MIYYFRILLLINLLLVISGIIIYSDTTLDEIRAIGSYCQDKYTRRNTSKGINDFEHLQLFSDLTFRLYSNDTLYLAGTWKIVNKQSDNKNVEFRFGNRVIKIDFDGYIFDVNYPNDFHSGKYERILFVKYSN